MTWLIVQMWVYLGLAFILGMVAYRWIFGGKGLSAEDVSAELASVRTRHQEAEAERARLRSKVLDLSNQLEETRRQLRSAEADAHAARAGLVAAEAAAASPAASRTGPLAAGEGAVQPDPRQSADPFEGASATSEPRPSSFMEVLREGGAPDDLTRIRGIGRKLEQKLNALGVYYFHQIAAWSDEEVSKLDAHLGFPGRIVRDDWRGQARALQSQADGA